MTHLTQVGVAATTKGGTFSEENTFIFLSIDMQYLKIK